MRLFISIDGRARSSFHSAGIQQSSYKSEQFLLYKNNVIADIFSKARASISGVTVLRRSYIFIKDDRSAGTSSSFCGRYASC